MSFHPVESSDCTPCEVCIGCHEQHADVEVGGHSAG